MNTQVICMLPLAAYQLILFFTVKKRQTTLRHELALLLFSFTILFILSSTGITPMSGLHFDIRPNEINLTPGSSLTGMLHISRSVGSFHIWGNILLFLPFGFLVPVIWKRNGLIRTVLHGALFSAFIEFLQLFLSRSTDVDDVILNSLGTLLGFVLSRVFLRVAPRFSSRIGIGRGGVFQPWVMIFIAILSTFVYGFMQCCRLNIPFLR